MKENIYNKFNPIRLDQMDEVKLMNRVDQKFCINIALLPDLLNKVVDDYYVLEIDDVRVFPYSNTYFDTHKDLMYNDHVRGKKTRFKVRQRAYVESHSSFFEIKFKNNRGKTFKSRIQCKNGESLYSDEVSGFLKGHSPFKPEELVPVLKNNFMRITLVSKTLDERCTIDHSVSFQINDTKIKLNRIAIIEVKSQGYPKNSKIVRTLRENHFIPQGFSKYCIGRSILDNTIKSNAYRTKLRQIEKVSNNI